MCRDIQILFRGLSVHNNQWVYGHYYRVGQAHFIINGKGVIAAIAKRTLGQYSGMQIGTQRKLFVGDKVAIQLEDGSIVEYVVKFGTNKRILNTGYLCYIPSFYFERWRDGEINRCYPICSNYQGVSDLKIMRYRGNIHEI